MKYILTLFITFIILVFFSGCKQVLVPEYVKKDKTILFDDLVLTNVQKHRKIKRRKLDYDSEGNVKAFDYKVQFHNHICKYLHYNHSYSYNYPAWYVWDKSIDNALTFETTEKIGNIYFLEKTTNENFNYIIFNKDKKRELAYIQTHKECFNFIKNHFKNK